MVRAVCLFANVLCRLQALRTSSTYSRLLGSEDSSGSESRGRLIWFVVLCVSSHPLLEPRRRCLRYARRRRKSISVYTSPYTSDHSLHIWFSNPSTAAREISNTPVRGHLMHHKGSPSRFGQPPPLCSLPQ